MIGSSELELHTRTKELFERENPGRLWRTPIGGRLGSAGDRSSASLTERQDYLTRIRAQMRAEGVQIKTEDENPPEPTLAKG